MSYFPIAWQQELIKNSLRATSERYHRELMAEPPEARGPHLRDTDGRASESLLPAFAMSAGVPLSKVPPVRVTINRSYSLVEGKQVQIVVADEGGGYVRVCNCSD